jgi:hypothetical protein
MSEFEIKTLFVSSENRDTSLFPAGNVYTLHLSNPIKQIKHVELIYASVPNTIYNIINGSNIIAFSNLTTSHENDISKLAYFSIPAGFYNASGVAYEIQAAVSNITGLSVAYLPNEGKFMISRPVSTPFSLYIPSTELAHVLGFNMTGTTRPSVNVPLPSAPGLIVPLYSDNSRYIDKHFIKSDNIVNLVTTEGVFLDIQELRTTENQQAVSLVGSAGTYDGQTMNRSFGVIPLDVPGGTIKRFKQASDYTYKVTYLYPIQRLDRLTISWIDKNGNIIDFNGFNDNSFLLKLYSERKKVT